MAVRLAREGYNLALNYRSDDTSAKIVQASCAEFGSTVHLYKADVSNYIECENMIKSVIDAQGAIYGLVNNAGIVNDGLIIRMTPQQFGDVINNNLVSAFNVTKPVVGYMLKAKLRTARIISISSVVGLQGNIGQSNYASAKAGLIGFTKSLAKELGSRNITVNAIAPGFITTDMTNNLADTVKDALVRTISLKRMGNVEDIAGAVAFLLGEDADYITGQTLCVDGGISL